MAIDPKAISKAKSRLRIAEKAFGEAIEAKSHTAFSDAWYTFLVAAKNIYTALEQGAKATPHDRQWFGAKKNERRADPLLQYLFQARDDDEHGIEEVVNLDPGHTLIGVAKPGFSQSAFIENVSMKDGKLEIKGVKGLDGKPVLIEHVPPHSRLATVIGRGPIKYPPPEEHLGSTLKNNLPITVGELALVYLSALVSEAEGRA